MTERPIIFSGPMVRAILEGRKTQTRRIMNNQPAGAALGPVYMRERDGGFQWYGIAGESSVFKCPYGKPGDRLWVRETWRIGAWNENTGEVCIDYCDGPRKAWLEIPEHNDPDGEVFERLWVQSSDDAQRGGIKPDENGRYTWEPGQSPCRWRPSIHMPRWASRITQEVASVRVERLQDIHSLDALAEGIQWYGDYYRINAQGHPHINPEDAFCDLWNSINLPPKPILKNKKVVAYESYPWSAGDFDAQYPGVRAAGSYRGKPITVVPNPWVWVVEFKRIQP